MNKTGSDHGIEVIEVIEVMSFDLYYF